MSNLARWSEVWEELGLKADPELHADLRLRYSSSSRHYHTLHHLMECLELFAETRELAEHPAEVELALWFHDAIYEVKRHDNEIRSAEWAQRALRKAGADDAVITRVYDLVMVTKHDGQPVTRDQELLSDIDLAILGARSSRFDEYERSRCARSTSTCLRPHSRRCAARSCRVSWRGRASTTRSGSTSAASDWRAATSTARCGSCRAGACRRCKQETAALYCV